MNKQQILSIIIIILLSSTAMTIIVTQRNKYCEKSFISHYDNILNEQFEYINTQTVINDHSKTTLISFNSKNYKIDVIDKPNGYLKIYRNDIEIPINKYVYKKYYDKTIILFKHIIQNNSNKFNLNQIVLFNIKSKQVNSNNNELFLIHYEKILTPSYTYKNTEIMGNISCHYFVSDDNKYRIGIYDEQDITRIRIILHFKNIDISNDYVILNNKDEIENIISYVISDNIDMFYYNSFILSLKK